MYMTLRNYRVPADQVDEVVRRVDEQWLERVRAMPGFVSYHVVRTKDGLASATTFLDEERGQRAAEASAEWVGAALMDKDVEFLDTSQGLVVVHGGA